MKVILLTDVKKQGKKDQVINVSDGYAKNFLIAQGLAVPYNEQNKNKLERDIKKRNDEEASLIDDCKKIAKSLENIEIKFKVKCGKDGRIFGSISSKQISEELTKMGFDIDKKKIECDHTIDSLGIHIVDVNLHKKVKAKVKVHVE